MQIPRLIEHFKEHKNVADRYIKKYGGESAQEYSFREYLKEDIKEFDVAISVPQNVFKPDSWAKYAKTSGVAFGSAALTMTVALVLGNHFLRRYINNLRAKKALKKTGQLR